MQQIQAQASATGKSKQTLAKEREKELRAKEKADEEKRKKEEAALFKPVPQSQKIPFGVDPKTILCAYFKAGTCEKGNKCKFSHDVNVGRKVEKKNLYEDSREENMKGSCVVRCLIFGCYRVKCIDSRYHGELGRGDSSQSCSLETRKSTLNN